MGAGTSFVTESARLWKASGLEYLFRPDPSLDWPEPWKHLWSKASPARTVWTYAELGNDMGDQPDPARRTALVSMIQGLSWPKGCVTFWPMNAPGEDCKPWLFWRGVQRVGAGAVLVFGREAADILDVQWADGQAIARGNVQVLTFRPLLECACDAGFPSSLAQTLEGLVP